MGKYTIKDVEALSGIKAHTLRIWEQRYKFIKPQRTATNIRYYTDEDLKLILNISLLNQHGYRISKISKMDVEEIIRIVKQISTNSEKADQRLESLVLAMVNLDEALFDKIINTAFLQIGFEETFGELVFPFMERIGVLWATGSINPLHEHFISNLIRQKLLVAIDGQVVRSHAGSKKFLLFLPEHERHELGLMFASFLLKARQHEVLYLGNSVPLKDLNEGIGLYRPDCIFTCVTIADPGNQFDKGIMEIAKKNKSVDIYVTGFQGLRSDYSAAANIIQIPTINDTIRLFDEI